MRIRAGAATALLAATVLATGAGTVAGSAPPSSSMYLDLDPQNIGNAIHLPPGADWHTFSTSDDRPIEAASVPGDGAQPRGFSVSDGAWTVRYVQEGGPIVPGTYAVPDPGEEESCGPTCVTVAAAPGNDCAGSGQFTIAAIAFLEDGTPETIDADFDLRCLGRVMAGSIRYRSDRPVPAMLQTHDVMPLGTAVVGESSASTAVTFTAAGTAPTEVGAVTITGDAAADFTLTGDSCSSATLDPGAACEVAVAFAPTGAGTRVADLRIPDTTAAGARRVRLVGAGFVPTSLSLEAGTIPTFGPAPATFELTVAPPAGAPLLFVDDIQAFGPTDVILDDPARQVFTYTVTLTPGHHVLTARLEPGGFHLGAVADPIELDVGIATTLTLSTATDDGVATGESATLVARLEAGSPLDAGTIRIIDEATDAVLAEGTPAGTSSTVEHGIPVATDDRPFRAEFVPAVATVEPATAAYDLVVVPGPRPETAMPATPVWSNSGMAVLDGFSSPDAGAAFQCRVDASDWFACTAPVVVHGTIADHVLSVRAELPNGLGDRTPATRPWLVELAPPTSTEPGTSAVNGQGAGLAGRPGACRVVGPGRRVGHRLYRVFLSTDGGAWSALEPSTRPWVVEPLRAGHDYRFRVRAVDRAGNVGSPRTGDAFTLAGIQDGSRRLAYRGTWTRRSGDAWWGGSARSSATRGATVSVTFTGRSISWVSATGPARGRARVYLDGRLVEVVDLGASAAQARTVVWTRNFPRTVTRALTIRVMGTEGRPRVDVDGFVVRR